MHSLTNLLSDPTPLHLITFAALFVTGAALLYLIARASPTNIVSIGIGLEIFSGNWKYMHIPAPLDRGLLALGLLSMVLGGRRMLADRTIVFRPVHVLLLVVAAWATVSALWAGTLTSHAGIYALFDRLGLVPFLAFTLAPLLFGDARRRSLLLAILIVVGLYLGVIAFMEGLGLERYTFPSYIHDPAVGILYGRARGPFVEAAADGLSLFICATAAGVGFVTWKGRTNVRVVCIVVMFLCGFGTIFTLTRSVWIGAALGAVVALVAAPSTRRYAIPLILAGALAVTAILVAVPGLETKASGRATFSASVYDRLNTNDAAERAIIEHPIFGIGWQEFPIEGPSYLRQAGTYPLTGAGLEVHNVFLSHAVELGIPGSILWTLALVSVVGGAVLRRGPPELRPWRTGMLAIFACFVVIANLGPLSYPFPNLLLWLWGGVAGTGYLSRPRGAGEMSLLDPESGATDRPGDRAAV